MAKPLLDDERWTLIEPLIPVKPRRKRHPGRKPRDNRACLEGILFVLRTGIPWAYLPAPFGCCGMTCWRRLRDWQAAGVWQKLHELLLARLHAANAIDWSRAVIDSGSVRAVGGAN
jgi:transposase